MMRKVMIERAAFAVVLMSMSGAAAGSDGPLFPSLALDYEGFTSEEADTFIADLDNDGDLDIATSGEDSQRVHVYLNGGDGSTFAPAVYFPGDDAPAITGADFNGDGYIDLAVAKWGFDGDVVIMLNQGDGTFAPGVDYPARFGPSDITTGDMNNDGNADVIVTDRFDSFIVILHGNGDGTFMPFTGRYVGEQPEGVEVGDMNGDGHLDLLAVSSFSNELGVSLNDGNGSYGNPAYYPVGSDPRRVRVADIDGDTDLDVVVVSRSSHNATVYKNDGGGVLSVHATVGVDFLPLDLRLTDLDADGSPDILVSNENERDIKILINDGAGNFAPDTGAGPYIGSARSVWAADMNGDGLVDIVAGSDRAHAISLQRADGSFDSSYSLSEIPRGWARYADLNGDGAMDIVASNGSSMAQRFTIAFGDGNGQVSSTTTITPMSNATVLDAIPSDIDGDGDADVVAMVQTVEFGKFDPYFTVSLYAYINDGSGNMTLTGTPVEVDSDIDEFYEMDCGDFDGDGLRDDFLVSNLYEAQIKGVSWNPLQSWTTMGTVVSVPGNGVGLEAIDYDMDGDDDIVSIGADQVIVRRNNGVFSFSAGGTIATGDEPVDIAIGDIDGDGDPDLVVLNEYNFQTDNTVRVIMNNGAGFDPGVELSIGYYGSSSVDYARRLAVGDVNLDGHADIVVSPFVPVDAVRVFLGDGTGGFVLDSSYLAQVPGAIDLVDLNMDDQLDVVISHTGWSPMVLLNQGGASGCPADLTGDGVLDFFDVSAFLSAFNAQDPDADFTSDGLFDFFDVSAFLSAYNAGCP